MYAFDYMHGYVKSWRFKEHLPIKTIMTINVLGEVKCVPE